MKAMPDRERLEPALSTLMILATGGLLGISSLPLPLGPLAWIALVPLLLLWDRATSPGWFLAECYTAFLIACAVGFFWPLLHLYSEAPWVVFASQLGLPLLWALPWIASLPFRQRFGRGAGLLMLLAGHLGVEQAMVEGPLAFPWPVLGHTQAQLTWLNQFADISGVAGLTLFVLGLNVFIFLYRTARRPRQRIAPALAVALLLGLSLTYSLWRRADVARAEQHVTVGLVQPALSYEDWTNRFGSTRLAHLLSLSDSLITSMNAPPVLVVWPEMALPVSGSSTRQARIDKLLRDWSERHGVALLTGSLAPADDRPMPALFHNRAVLYEPDRGMNRYDQVHLLPFRSSAPLDRHAPWLGPDRPTHLLPGERTTPLDLDPFRAGVLLGYEVLVGDHARALVKQGTDFFITLHVDGWGGRTPGFRPHLNYLRLRAIEMRRSVVQVAASGSTSLVAPDGSVIYQSAYQKPDAHLAAVRLVSSQTPYARYGNWLGWLGLIASLTAGAWMGGTTLLERLRKPRWTGPVVQEPRHGPKPKVKPLR